MPLFGQKQTKKKAQYGTFEIGSTANGTATELQELLPTAPMEPKNSGPAASTADAEKQAQKNEIVSSRMRETRAEIRVLSQAIPDQRSIEAYLASRTESRLAYFRRGDFYYEIRNPEITPDTINSYSEAQLQDFLVHHRNELFYQRFFTDSIIGAYDTYSDAYHQGKNLLSIPLNDIDLLFHMPIKKCINLVFIERNDKIKAHICCWKDEGHQILDLQAIQGELRPRSCAIDMDFMHQLRTEEEIRATTPSKKVIEMIMESDSTHADVADFESKYANIQHSVIYANIKGSVVNAEKMYKGHCSDDLKTKLDYLMYCFITRLPGSTSQHILRSLIENKKDRAKLSRLSIKMQHMNKSFIHSQRTDKLGSGLIFGLHVKYRDKPYIRPITYLAAESVPVMVDSDLQHEANGKAGFVNPRSNFTLWISDVVKVKEGYTRQQLLKDGYTENKGSLCIYCTAQGIIGTKGSSKAHNHLISSGHNLDVEIASLKYIRDNPDYYDCPDYARCYLTGVITILEQYQEYLEAAVKDEEKCLRKLKETIDKFNELFPFSAEAFRFDKFQKMFVTQTKITKIIEARAPSLSHETSECAMAIPHCTEEEMRQYYTEGRAELTRSRQNIVDFVRDCERAGFHSGRKEVAPESIRNTDSAATVKPPAAAAHTGKPSRTTCTGASQAYLGKNAAASEPKLYVVDFAEERSVTSV